MSEPDRRPKTVGLSESVEWALSVEVLCARCGATLETSMDEPRTLRRKLNMDIATMQESLRSRGEITLRAKPCIRCCRPLEPFGRSVDPE